MTNPKHTDTSRSGDLVERFNRFLSEWGKSRQYGDVIYGLHVGTDREVELTATSIRQAADRIEALTAENERLREALQWFVDNDDTNEGNEPMEEFGGQSWDEINAYWIDGLNRARTVLAGKGEE